MNSLSDRIRRIRQAIRAKQPIAERIELIRKVRAQSQPVPVRVEQNGDSGYQVRGN